MLGRKLTYSWQRRSAFSSSDTNLGRSDCLLALTIPGVDVITPKCLLSYATKRRVEYNTIRRSNHALLCAVLSYINCQNQGIAAGEPVDDEKARRDGCHGAEQLTCLSLAR